jgi:hypothetical protein
MRVHLTHVIKVENHVPSTFKTPVHRVCQIAHLIHVLRRARRFCPPCGSLRVCAWGVAVLFRLIVQSFMPVCGGMAVILLHVLGRQRLTREGASAFASPLGPVKETIREQHLRAPDCRAAAGCSAAPTDHRSVSAGAVGPFLLSGFSS